MIYSFIPHRFDPPFTMLGRTLTIRGLAAAVLQTHTPPTSAGSQHSILLAWMTLRKAGASPSCTPPQASTSAHVHSRTFSFLKNTRVQHKIPSLSRPQCCLHTLQTPFHHLQTYATLSLPLIATRGLATLSSTSTSRNNAHNRSLPDWSPRGVLVMGGVAVGVKGMAKDKKGGFNNLHGRISSLQIKKRVQRKKKKIQEESEEVRLFSFIHHFKSIMK